MYTHIHRSFVGLSSLMPKRKLALVFSSKSKFEANYFSARHQENVDVGRQKNCIGPNGIYISLRNKNDGETVFSSAYVCRCKSKTYNIVTLKGK